jgi:hypothetical protein
LPTYTREAIAISPDGKLIAVGQKVAMSGSPSGTQPTIVLFDIASGKNVATLIQDQFRGGGGESLYAGFELNGIIFTSESKHLITSGLNTRIWAIG